ncbi:hypothetical protein B0H19DRAFT_1069575 [Mycena capillaripes]|nr:hypothetical protein B0H19DRAFT_1069575 [Mycena capillaripes]
MIIFSSWPLPCRALRETFNPNTLDTGFSVEFTQDIPSRTILIAELHTTQADTAAYSNTTGSNLISSLFIVPTRADPTKFIQEYKESSAISGFATVDGLWTFVEGGFTLLFGANVPYFLFGRRPLSALGIVHIFERRRLVRQWHRDFPALRTEGGTPGFEGAGIVAFLRERLVDIGDDEEFPVEPDLEAQNKSRDIHGNELRHNGCPQEAQFDASRMSDDDTRSIQSDNSSDTTKSIWKGGYRLDEIPLMDKDLVTR